MGGGHRDRRHWTGCHGLISVGPGGHVCSKERVDQHTAQDLADSRDHQRSREGYQEGSVERVVTNGFVYFFQKRVLLAGEVNCIGDTICVAFLFDKMLHMVV